MTSARLPSLFGLVLVTTITPGPNNLIVLVASATGSGQRVAAAFGGVLVGEAFARTGHDPGRHLPSSAAGLALFQLARPKAWVLCIAAVSAMQVRESGAIGLALLAALFVVATRISLAAWALLGRLLPDLREPSAAAAPVLALLGLGLVLCSVTLLGSTL